MHEGPGEPRAFQITFTKSLRTRTVASNLQELIEDDEDVSVIGGALKSTIHQPTQEKSKSLDKQFLPFSVEYTLERMNSFRHQMFRALTNDFTAIKNLNGMLVKVPLGDAHDIVRVFFTMIDLKGAQHPCEILYPVSVSQSQT